MKILCDVYKTSRHQEMYLYVDRKEGLERVPPELLERFGEPELALNFVLTPERNLAKEDAEEVIKNLKDKGFHLQLPPQTVGGLGRRD